MAGVTRSLVRWVRPGQGRPPARKLVLGIETSCDDTGAAVVDDAGGVLGEALHCQGDVHSR